ncbi:TIR-NBS-LRR class disease resistance protein [Rhynchospora pubera]|uniref:TIR-NBS-LRR class disease resistance protein n=1 Tax=Rhynchospora pubera TaxID=906938 RepID=A0AAV8F8B0_9POAL|nr:TIR-NBS-LRR class disease resistance protein [Rhynchospora pubera]
MWELLTLWTKNIPPGLVQKTPWLATRWELIKNISVKKCVDKISWVSFFNNTGRWIIHPRPNPTTSLVLRCCSDLSKFSLETLFPLLKHLRILDLSYTSLEQMPPSISLMVNLRFLSLKGCNQLMTLTPNSSLNSSSSPFTALQHVEVLDLGGTSLNTIPDDVAKSKFMLRYLDLSCSSITSLSSFFFQDICSSLKELFFLGCTSLQSLPSSLINLINLETFSLSESQITSLPKETFERMSKLRDLNFKNNKLLLCLPKLAEHTKLKSLSLSGSPITHLSLQGCQSLKTVSLYDLDQLEELVLSATGIKEFPECILDLHRLRRLDLLALPQLRRLPWHKLHHIPEVFNFDQCECETMGDPQFVVHRSIEENLQLSSINNGVRFFLTDSKLFSSFTSQVCKHLVHEEGSLRSFYILVSSCNERRRKDIGIGVRDQFKKKTPSCYKDIPFMESTFKQQFEQSPPFSRHVEISSAERYPAGLEDILKVTESLSMSDDVFVSSLTDLNQDFPKLQNCQLQKCHLMDSIFVGNVNVQAPNLQTLWVSDLRNMKTVLSKQTFKEDNNDIYTRINPLDLFFREEKNLRQEILRRDIRQQAFVIRAALRFAAAGIPRNNFIAVKHIHLEYCPRLECIFSDDLTLYNLETLTVVHCNNLRTVFDQDKRGVKNHFLKLHSIQLHELPKLSHFDEKQKAYHQMPGWKELHFRGCWNLRRLPLLVGPRHQKVHVDGEARQCKKLQAVMGEDQISYYDFMSPPPLASFRECVKNKIFLR